MKQGRNSADDCLPKFFKVYLPGKSRDDLEIPVSFNSCLPKPLPKNVTLRSIYGKIWKMALTKCCGDVEKYVLVNGWKRIAKDEELAGGDLLEFDFDGSRYFNFCIYEPLTTCKRLRRSSVQGDEETRATDEALRFSDDDDDSEDADDNDAILEDEDDDDDVEDVEDIDDDDDQRQYLDDPDNASFTVILNPKKKSQLPIPSKVIKDYGLKFAESITIVDPLVKKFGTVAKKIKIQLNGRVFIKGYGTILRRNGVKSSDKMICELKKAGNNNLVHTIKFHIIK